MFVLLLASTVVLRGASELGEAPTGLAALESLKAVPQTLGTLGGGTAPLASPESSDVAGASSVAVASGPFAQMKKLEGEGAAAPYLRQAKMGVSFLLEDSVPPLPFLLTTPVFRIPQ